MEVVGKHGSEEFRQLAEAGTILRVQVGSGVHGTSIAGTDDRDEMGVCIEPEDYVYGLKPLGTADRFEQYENHTAWQRTGSLKARSGPGDLDIVIYSLRKFVRLALAGNPSIIGLFFTPEKDIVKVTGPGQGLLMMAPYFISKAAGPKYLGYLNEQRRRMQAKDGKGKDVTRPELIERYGFDTKFAGHMIRLGYQGIELMKTGRITLPMKEEEREHVKAIRTGQFPMSYVLSRAEHMEEQLRRAMEASGLPDHPDRQAVNDWLVDTYNHEWFMRSIAQ